MEEEPVERNLGEQPIAKIMAERSLDAHALVSASEVPMTHKMVARAVKGRRLTRNTQEIVRKALSRATGTEFRLDELFNYR